MKTIPFKRERINDAKRAVILEITPADIAKADRLDPATCAIACAARRQLGAEDVRIHLSRVYIRKGNRWLRYMTGTALKQELIAFDRGGNFSPGEFYLAAMTPSRQTGRQQGSPSPYVPRRPYHHVLGVRPDAVVELQEGRGEPEELSP